jgi:hypothetical protein
VKKRAALVMALVMFAGACSADRENEIADPTVERSVTTEEQPVAEPAAAPQPTATTAPQPTATPTPDPLVQVVDAYLAFLNVFGDERFDNVPDFEALAQVSTASWVDQVRAVLPSAKPSWQVTIDPNIEDISIDGTSATITDCHGFRRVFDDPTQPTPDNAIVWDRYETRTVEMVFADEEWKFNNQTVTGVNADGVAGTVLCVPSADRAQLEALPEAYFAAVEASFDNGGVVDGVTARLADLLDNGYETFVNDGTKFQYPTVQSGATIITFDTTGAVVIVCVVWGPDSGYLLQNGQRDSVESPPVGTVHSLKLGAKRTNNTWLTNENLFEERETCEDFDSEFAHRSVSQ